MNNSIRQSKAAFYHKEIEQNSGNSREIWKTINSLMSRKTKDSSINELKADNVSFTEPILIADQFNKHFTEIGTKLASVLPESDCDYEQYV